MSSREPDGAKSRILARRKKFNPLAQARSSDAERTPQSLRPSAFIAAALTTMGASMGLALEGCPAQACLEPTIAPGYDAGSTRDAADAEPQACLFAPPPEDTGGDAANPVNSDAADAARDGVAGG